ncbi:fungal transcriptional regulatory protein [Pochonia chlamydosporia 170]|uniref:Fungal transcriptional regulatory protein n=1 Tax=Pochonia chlamydosporia 170 TaxID=1380566 RepID=A0A179FS32_METCM|nr:fungal transcriptional regulatory protein [Pochonia chlamydosporia 170]OAQ68010.1 fungal transcriptional regulatory protein [Pochonia chlamydosporia 170]
MAGQRKDIARRASTTGSAGNTAVSGSTGDAAEVPGQRVKKWAPKVRTGCLTCRARRVKCDEGKPGCHRCVSTGRTCKGYQDVSPKTGKKDGESSRRRSSHGVRSSRPNIDQIVPAGYADDRSTSDGSYGFDRSLSATSSMNHVRERESSSETLSTDHHLSDLLGGLKVNEQGIAPYLRRKPPGDEHQVDEEEVDDDDDDDDESEYLNLILPMTKLPGHRVRIPPQLMPLDSTALQYFELYFEHVHPYVPVLDKVAFYRQWNTDPDSISPLILETVFAIGSRLGEENPRVSNHWLALASKHADDFMDVPRLSTLQGLLIMIKAREGAPNRGYYYRSWMMVVQCVRMGKDLGLDEHYENHESGEFDSCNLSPAECQLQTRLWQVVFVCETMIGTPQGRRDLSVNVDTVDFSEPSPNTATSSIADDYESEHRVSRTFVYMARLVRNVRKLNALYLGLKKRKNWGIQPEYLSFEKTMKSFLSNLPPDLTIEYHGDSTSLSWLPSAFLGNLHSYYYLSIILFHRGVLGFLDPSVNGSLWKRHMMVCYDSARHLCRLQEATKKEFGLVGLQSMQRGFSFTVYAGLSCVVLHLVAIVSPDPDLNSDAREYFERHMRVMEEVMQAWPMPDLQKQIDAFREAFSADLSKPFVLRPEFPYIRQGKEPSKQLEQPLTEITAEPAHVEGPTQFDPSTSQQPQPSLLDISAGDVGSSITTHLDSHNIPLSSPSTHPNWNPAPIFKTWNSFFAPPPQARPVPVPAVPPQPHLSNTMNSYAVANVPSGPEDFPLPDTQTVGPSSLLPNYEKTPQVGQQQHVAQQYTSTEVMGFITPGMWQDLVATVYEEGQTQHF